MKQSDIRYEVPPQPRQLRLDTTTKCNAQCVSCHRFLSDRKGEMPRELLVDILDDVSRWGEPLQEIIPVNYGEFFANKDWYWILQMISPKLPHTQIVIPTNGALLTPEMVTKLCEIPSIKIVNFSLNAYFDETYEAFNKLPASNIPKIRNYAMLLRALRPDITIWASMVFDPEYQTDLERDKFKEYWSPFAAPQILPAASAGRGKPILTPVIAPCRSIFSDFVVGYDGKLSSCCFDSRFSLDIGEYSGDLKSDWHNSKLEEFRKLHNEHKRAEIGLCKSCTFA